MPDCCTAILHFLPSSVTRLLWKRKEFLGGIGSSVFVHVTMDTNTQIKAELQTHEPKHSTIFRLLSSQNQRKRLEPADFDAPVASPQVKRRQLGQKRRSVTDLSKDSAPFNCLSSLLSGRTSQHLDPVFSVHQRTWSLEVQPQSFTP